MSDTFSFATSDTRRRFFFTVTLSASETSAEGSFPILLRRSHRSGGAGGCGPPSFLGQARARTMPVGKSATVITVMTVTAWSAGLCFFSLQGGNQMFDLHTFESLRTAAAVEERNERPLLAALFAVNIGWSIAGLIALA